MVLFFPVFDRYTKVQERNFHILELDWKREWFNNISQFQKSHWELKKNQKEFLDSLALKLQIKNPKDWGKIAKSNIQELRRTHFLSKLYGGSLFNCLQSVYSGMLYCLSNITDIQWKKEWFVNAPKSSWSSLEVQKKFMDEIASKMNVKKASDWGEITTTRFKEIGGNTILSLYNGSLFSCLQAIYKGIYKPLDNV